ncbi:MAG: hypothetical protein QOD45_1133 [Pseudonocardiales bacterium]|nr:hypothetical protein [Pseudonocardiales bacterium]
MAVSLRRLLRRLARRFRRVPAGGHRNIGGRPGRGRGSSGDDGGTPVREPRRPKPKPTAGAAALPLPEASERV